MISIDLGDITILDCDAIVNAANKTLLGGLESTVLFIAVQVVSF